MKAPRSISLLGLALFALMRAVSASAGACTSSPTQGRTQALHQSALHETKEAGSEVDEHHQCWHVSAHESGLQKLVRLPRASLALWAGCRRKVPDQARASAALLLTTLAIVSGLATTADSAGNFAPMPEAGALTGLVGGTQGDPFAVPYARHLLQTGKEVPAVLLQGTFCRQGTSQ